MSNATDMSNGAGSTDELIEFLSLRMFPEKLTITAQSDVVAGARKAELDESHPDVPEFRFRDSGYWVQGVNFALNLRY